MSIKQRLSSHSVRMVTLYVLFFLLSVIGFLVLIFGAVGVEIESNVKSEIEREQARVMESVIETPSADFASILTPYIRSANPSLAVYILEGPDETLISNYPKDVTLSDGWQYLSSINSTDASYLGFGADRSKIWQAINLRSEKSYEKGYIGKAITQGDYTLFIGRTLASINETKTVFLRIALLALPLSIFLAGLSGYMFDRLTLRRIELINEKCRAIRQKGDISLRVPNNKPDDEYGLLIANINAMLETIDKSVQNIQVVSDDIAHDLRTPLTRLKYGLESGLLDPNATPKELKKIIGVSLGETDSLLETFSAILRISQLNTGRRRSKFIHFDLSDLITIMVEAYAPIAEEKGHTLTSQLNPHHCFMTGDKDMITQVISNLIENCFSHAGESLKISVKVDCEQDYVTLSVSDTGFGVKEADTDKIFNKFYRGDKSRSEPGSGLGLAIVKAVSDLHGGKIIVSDNSPGLSIAIRFPRTFDI